MSYEKEQAIKPIESTKRFLPFESSDFMSNYYGSHTLLSSSGQSFANTLICVYYQMMCILPKYPDGVV